MSLSRPTAHTIARQLGVTAAICSAAFGLSAASALAASVSPAPATCTGQTFSQAFAAFGDTNEYTLVQDGNFNSGSEGWELSKGAQIVTSGGPHGSTGGVLDLPSGATAVSPPVCVTLEYPTARVFVRDVKGSEGVAVGLAYAGTNRTVASPQNVGQVHGQQTDWTLSNPINVQPQIAGSDEGTREARFVFTAGGNTSEFQLSGLYVDPRMR